LDVLIYGHSHVAALERVPGAGIFANAGSWLDAPTYLELHEDRLELREWGKPSERDASAQSNCLDVVNR
ncbi:MAG: hypothetical protein ACR2GG_09440, partial [Gemmatimonadaceae bacterium]